MRRPRRRIELLRFESPYQAINPAVRRAYALHEHNGLARAQHWLHDDSPPGRDARADRLAGILTPAGAA
jgi:hypothetical protein